MSAVLEAFPPLKPPALQARTDTSWHSFLSGYFFGRVLLSLELYLEIILK